MVQMMKISAETMNEQYKYHNQFRKTSHDHHEAKSSHSTQSNHIINLTYHAATDFQFADSRSETTQRNHLQIHQQHHREVRLQQHLHELRLLEPRHSRYQRLFPRDGAVFAQSLVDLQREQPGRHTFARRRSSASWARRRPFRLQTRISRRSFSFYAMSKGSTRGSTHAAANQSARTTHWILITHLLTLDSRCSRSTLFKALELFPLRRISIRHSKPIRFKSSFSIHR